MPLKIAVVELEDGSKERGWSKQQIFNESLIALVPSAPILVKLHDTRFGKCLSSELNASRQFSRVDYHENWEKMAEQFKAYDLIVTGHLHQDRTEATQHFYGLSMPGDLLWLVGLPYKSYSRLITLDIRAFNPSAPEQVLWNHQIRVEIRKYEGFYYGKHADGRDLMSKAYGVDSKDTDYCPTELLQPEFMALRNSLAATVKNTVTGKKGLLRTQ